MIAAAELGLLDGFERALLNRRLHMVYQPKVSLADGRLTRRRRRIGDVIDRRSGSGLSQFAGGISNTLFFLRGRECFGVA